MKSNIITTLLFALQASTAFGEDPVTTTGDCDDFGITQWPDCNSKCSELAGPGIGYSARVNGGMGNISACFCEYGRNRENSFTCTRTPTFPPIPERRGEKCRLWGIDDQETCFAFCQEYERLPQYVGNDNGMLWCRCSPGQDADFDFDCKGDQGSYLRSG